MPTRTRRYHSTRGGAACEAAGPRRPAADTHSRAFAAGRPASYGEGTDFTRALSLANYLTGPELSGVKTVAYVPRTIKGHGVLMALACDEIVMNPEAELGEASIDEDSSRAIEPKIVSAYKDIVARSGRYQKPSRWAWSIGDSEVSRSKRTKGSSSSSAASLERIKKDHTIISQEDDRAGRLARQLYRSRRTRIRPAFGQRYRCARPRAGVSSAAMKQDESKMGEWRPVMLRIEGPITPRKVRQLETLIGTELRSAR